MCLHRGIKTQARCFYFSFLCMFLYFHILHVTIKILCHSFHRKDKRNMKIESLFVPLLSFQGEFMSQFSQELVRLPPLDMAYGE